MVEGLDDPEKRRKVVRTLLWLTPAMFVFGYAMVYLTEFQPTARVAMIVGSASALLSLGAAVVIAMFEERSARAFQVIAIVLGLISFLATACSG